MKISVDFGITVTDAIAKEDDNVINHKMLMSSEEPSEKIIKDLFPNVDFKTGVDFISVTGGKHLNIKDSIENTPVYHVNEVDAVGEGAVTLAKLNKSKKAIIVSAGSGTACIFAHNNKYVHCSGTGVGGGTILGLSKLLIGTQDPSEIEELANKGDPTKTDLILEDVVSGPIGSLPQETTAVNFGKISKIERHVSREDLAAGIINLVGQTAARIATSVAIATEASEIIVVGRSPNFIGLRSSLETAAALTNFTPHFPDNGEYASALGALLLIEKNPAK